MNHCSWVAIYSAVMSCKQANVMTSVLTAAPHASSGPSNAKDLIVCNIVGITIKALWPQPML